MPLKNNGFILADGKQLEYRWFAPQDPTANRPALIFLHEGLGCVELWRNWPDRIAALTGLGVLVYSRAGYGRSEPVILPRPASYMHHEAEIVLPQVLAEADIDQAILVGHSDGGSIAVIYAGSHSTIDLNGIVLLAPHVFNENICIESILGAGDTYRRSDLRRRLARYHSDVDNAFWGWHDAWLSSEFRDWNIEAFLDNINAPVLLIQGENDQYGTLAQIDAIQRRLPALVQRLVFSDCGHFPHQDQPELTRNYLVNFIMEHSTR